MFHLFKKKKTGRSIADFQTQYQSDMLATDAMGYIRRGNNRINRAVVLLIQEQSREVVKKDYCGSRDFDSLVLPVEKWKQCQYRSLSILLDMPLGTVRRFLKGEATQLHSTNKQKIADFLGLKDWEEIEEKALFRLFKDTIA